MHNVVHEELALVGGPKAVSVTPQENWPVPTERIKAAIGRLIDHEIYSEGGHLASSAQRLAAAFGFKTSVSDLSPTIELEKRFAAYMGSKFCLAQNTGTSTLWAAYYALGVGCGDEVLHPAYGWICAISPAVHLGARPVFCEVTPRTLTIDPADMEKRITSRTKAVSIIHVHGVVCDMDAIMSIARKHGIAVIEDCSHCHGAEWDGRKVGSIGNIGCFSLNGNVTTGKPLPAGEGGLVVTDSRELYERMGFYGHLNKGAMIAEIEDPGLRSLIPTNAGIKFRSHPWAMALALVMFDSLDERNEKRREYRRKVCEALSEVAGVDVMVDHPKSVPAGFFGGMRFVYRPEELGGLPLADYLAVLQAEGVQVGPAGPYYLTHRLKLFAEGYDIYGTGGPLTDDYPGYPEGSLPISEDVHAHLFEMPTFIEETPGYSDQVILAFQKIAARHATLQTRKARVRMATQTASRSTAASAEQGLRKVRKVLWRLRGY
jgi:dTDP-4-amino-4,6-dideoxygalactose transaminase